MKTHSYEHARGLHLSTSYSDGTTPRQFSYNHLGQPTQVTDESGTRTFGYNSYGERISDSLSVDGDTHLIAETQDAMGSSTGFSYSKNGSVQHTVTTDYGTDGRINSAGFLHGGAEKVFGYEYLSGSNLLHKLTKPNGMMLTQSYETQRDLLTGMAYHRGSTLVAQREYTYDVLSRPTARTTSRQGNVVNDTFVHNSRSELASAQVNGETYGYDYDNVGNRRMSMEAGDYAFYEANALNQYTDITGSEDEADFSFTPVFDADGNQTLIKTETGIWSAAYNAENRPVSFTNEATGTVVTCAYDSMGRRSFKFLKSMTKNQIMKETSVGHTWIRLENTIEQEIIEGGHSGEDPEIREPGIDDENFETYGDGVYALMNMYNNGETAPFPHIPEADPQNPIRWLWHIYQDGHWAEGSGGHEKVTSECSWCISKNEYEKAHRYIDEVKKNIKYYGLTGNQCTSTAAKIAKKAGVNVNPYVILSLPRSLSEKNILWTNPKYNRITFALPDKMQDIMKHAGNDRVKSCR